MADPVDLGKISKLAIPEDVVFQVLEGEAVILNLRDGLYFGLNPTGTRIWQLIEQHGDLDAIREAMLQTYEVAPESLENDLREVISRLVEIGLIVAEPRS